MKELKKTTSKKLGELLVERGIINLQQLNKAVEIYEQKGGLIGQLLVDLKFATEEDIAQALTCQYDFPFLPLANYEVDPEIMKCIPKDVCLKYILAPIDKIGKSLTLAMANPLNTQAAEEIEKITGCTVQAFVSTTSDIKKYIEKYHNG